jgi:malonate transporter
MIQAAASLLPFFLVVLAGYVVGIAGWGGTDLRKSLIAFCFYLGIPALLLKTIVSTPVIDGASSYVIWAAYLTPAFICWLVATFLTLAIGGGGANHHASVALAATYGNVLMLGIPLALAQFGALAAPVVAMIVLVHSPVLFALAALHSVIGAQRVETLTLAGGDIGDASTTLHLPSQRGARLTQSLSELVADLVTNPIILAIALALAIRLANWTLPSVVMETLAIISRGTLPCVLVAIGLGLSSFKLKGEVTTIVVITLLKIIVMPVLAWFIGTRYLSLPGANAAVIVFLSAMPVGANAVIFAGRNGTGEASVSGAVAISTLLAPLTLSVTLSFLGQITT